MASNIVQYEIGLLFEPTTRSLAHCSKRASSGVRHGVSSPHTHSTRKNANAKGNSEVKDPPAPISLFHPEPTPTLRPHDPVEGPPLDTSSTERNQLSPLSLLFFRECNAEGSDGTLCDSRRVRRKRKLPLCDMLHCTPQFSYRSKERRNRNGWGREGPDGVAHPLEGRKFLRKEANGRMKASRRRRVNTPRWNGQDDTHALIHAQRAHSIHICNAPLLCLTRWLPTPPPFSPKGATGHPL